MAFYKKISDDEVLCAPNFVKAPTYTLEAELKDTYEYPIDGWVWYTQEEADQAFGVSN